MLRCSCLNETVGTAKKQAVPQPAAALRVWHGLLVGRGKRDAPSKGKTGFRPPDARSGADGGADSRKASFVRTAGTANKVSRATLSRATSVTLLEKAP